jgi:hypothetical protein
MKITARPRTSGPPQVASGPVPAQISRNIAPLTKRGLLAHKEGQLNATHTNI